MSGIYTLLILSSVLAVGTALKCYACESSTSWDDCKQNSQKGLCLESSVTSCLKAEIKVKSKTTGEIIDQAYKKGCAKTCDKNVIKMCKDGHYNGNPVTCSLHCCSGDYCNAGSSLVASIINPAICALITVVFTKLY